MTRINVSFLNGLIHQYSNKVTRTEAGSYRIRFLALSHMWITFILLKPFQIGLAALWSVVLGIIPGFYNRRK